MQVVQVDSATRLGLVDTPHRIHFGRDPTGLLPPLLGPSAAAMVYEKDGKGKEDNKSGVLPKCK